MGNWLPNEPNVHYKVHACLLDCMVNIYRQWRQAGLLWAENGWAHGDCNVEMKR